MTVKITSSQDSGDARVYTVLLHENGVGANWDYVKTDEAFMTVYDTVTVNKTDTFQIVEKGGVFSHGIRYLQMTIPFFRMHSMEKKDVKMVNGEYEWKSTDPVSTYRTNIGLTYIDIDHYNEFSFTTIKMKLTLQSFNGDPVTPSE